MDAWRDSHNKPVTTNPMSNTADPAFLISSIALASAGAGILASMILVTSSPSGDNANRVLGVFVLALSAMLAQRFLSHSGLIFEYPHLQGATQYLRFLLGPCLYIYVRLQSQPNFTMTRKQLWHGVPALLSLIAFIPVYLQSADIKQTFIGAYMKPFQEQSLTALQAGTSLEISAVFQINLLLVVFFLIHLGCYALISLVYLHRHRTQIRSHFSSLDRITLGWLYGLVCLVLSLCVIALVFTVRYRTNPEISFSGQEFSPTALLACIVYYVGFMGLRQPLIYRQSAEESVDNPEIVDPAVITPPKYGKSGLSAEDQQSIWEALQACMPAERLHQRADLTLSILAETLNVRAAHLSQTINVEAGMNFFDFINQYRIQEAKRLLRQSGNDIPLSTMGYEVGFNSKSTFYSQFKKHSDGMTPRQYLKSLSSQ